MEKKIEQKRTFFHYFGIACLIFLFAYLTGYYFTRGVQEADDYQKTQKELVSKYFECSRNMKEVGENLCAKFNSSYNYYYPIGVAYGLDLDFEYIKCEGGELFSLSKNYNEER